MIRAIAHLLVEAIWAGVFKLAALRFPEDEPDTTSPKQVAESIRKLQGEEA